MADVKPVTDAAVVYGDQRAAEATAPLNQQIDQLEAQVADLTAQLEECQGGGEPEPPETGVRRVPIFGAATSNNQTEFNTLNNQWGPIRATREYDSGDGFRPVNQYAWFNFSKQFDYLFFSADAGNADYPNIASGQFDGQIEGMIASMDDLPDDMRGVILLGNEPNTDKGIAPADYRAAIEHCMDTFGDEPYRGFVWGIAFSNYNAWGGGRTDAKKGENWLPRRENMRFCVETHCYGKSEYTPPETMLGRYFTPYMETRPNWDWCVGEMSAQEDSGHTKKANWFTQFGDYCEQHNACAMLPFDTGVGGSAPINTSEASRKAVQAIAQGWQNNNWQ